ncbi:unnamed protein product [Brachionus calyciflorus]|uniref:Uncharacterized protein n=1 Tax=Brachionus calyciflorus TaxID=104777 RepID=A0A813U291_9BILA|nr:unnamed protein product [Brachionus calyciflorus]
MSLSMDNCPRMIQDPANLTSTSCLNQILCPKGGFGVGGCYLKSSQACDNGRICSGSPDMKYCSSGRFGHPGGCYFTKSEKCFNGIICKLYEEICDATLLGGRGKYLKSNSYCSNGYIYKR